MKKSFFILLIAALGAGLINSCGTKTPEPATVAQEAYNTLLDSVKRSETKLAAAENALQNAKREMAKADSGNHLLKKQVSALQHRVDTLVAHLGNYKVTLEADGKRTLSYQ